MNKFLGYGFAILAFIGLVVNIILTLQLSSRFNDSGFLVSDHQDRLDSIEKKIDDMKFDMVHNFKRRY